MIKVIVCDIDNTLVPKHKKPSQRTLDCIHEFEKRGILFGLASGRGTQSLRDLANEWGIHCDILIGNNGGEYQDEITGEHDVLPKLTKDELKEIFKLMEPFKDKTNVSMIISGVHKVRRIDENIIASFKYRKNSEMPVEVNDESEFWQEECYKVGFRTTADVTPLIEETVKNHPIKNIQGLKTEYTMFEFFPEKANKGDMLLRFLKNHNIDVKDSVAFGDMTNDVSLLLAAGVGVCMENGSKDAKEAADIITEKSIEDDGWSDYVINNILN